MLKTVNPIAQSLEAPALGQPGSPFAGPCGAADATRRGLPPAVKAVFILLAAFFGLGLTRADDLQISDANPLAMPPVGSYGLRILSPTILELTLIATKAPDPARVQEWDFVGDNFQLNAPVPSEFAVSVDGQPVAVKNVGFKRRVLYAPLKVRDLRIGNYLYLELTQPIAAGQSVKVLNPSARLWTASRQFRAVMDPLRWGPPIHVNQVGYAPAYPKKAMIGYYLGSLGELQIPVLAFQLIESASGKVVYQGQLVSRPDTGYNYTPPPYQQVYQADFSAFSTPGQYRLVVPGLGASFPFFIDEGMAGAFARAFALGLFHQRCGFKEALPFTRFTHEACHTAPADVPTMAYQAVQDELAQMSSDYASNPRHTAPQLKDVNSSLYPFIHQGQVDVSGGHHDAGDYSKYTINSAGLIHYLVFAADSFSGAGDLDNLGIPESGDGKSDLLEEAKWEADYLAKMQDADGGFYFLVYPRDREYEDDVLPDHGDPQVVFPKTTAVTAAALAALAEIASSPRFKQQFPTASALYLQKALLGWSFLTNAIAKYGKDGSYQKITHYGNEFMHDDELAWSAAALFAATGNPVYEQQLMAWYDPSDAHTRRWTWWRLFEGYGCAARTYAFAARSGRLAANQLDPVYLAKCEAEIKAAADDQVRFAQECAYGSSFPDQNKVYRSAGWYFSSERAFDVTVAYQLWPKPEYLDTIVSNFNYEGGCNPVNMTYITGLGWKRQREIVHQYAENDHAVLPPSGLPLGNIQSGFIQLYLYKSEPAELTFPPDYATTAPYPYYDRWADTFNTTTEFVVVDLARSMASLSYWMAQSSLKTQPWRAAAAQITGLPAQTPADQPLEATVLAPGLDLSQARVVWEARDQQPYLGPAFQFAAKFPGRQWVEVEAQLPDGRRVFAATNFLATTALDAAPNSFQSAPVTPGSATAALYHLDNSGSDATDQNPALSLSGGAALDSNNLGWMTSRTGAALRVNDLGDEAVVDLPAVFGTSTPQSLLLEAMVYVNSFKAANRQSVSLLSLSQNWNANFRLMEDPYTGVHVQGGTVWDSSGSGLTSSLPLKKWFHLALGLDASGYTLKIDGRTVAAKPSAELANWSNAGLVRLELGNFDGWIDEVVVTANGGPPGGTIIPANPPPVVFLTSPLGGAVQAATNVLLWADAPDLNGSIAKVEFFANDSKVGEVTGAPFQFQWAGPMPGTYSITAQATDNLGATGRSIPISITLTQAVAAPLPVQPPVMTPPGGAYDQPVLVTLTTATDGATIYYTTDGTDPGQNSTIYLGPISLPNSCTLRAVAFKSGAAASPVTSAVFSIAPPPAPAPEAPKVTFVKTDAATQGSWKGSYGSEGFDIIGNYSSYPAFAEIEPGLKANYTWEDSTSDPRALQKSGATTDRIASSWFADSAFTLDAGFSDGQRHRLALYFLDWDGNNRQELVEILDPATGAVLDAETVRQFNGGKYLVWDIQGKVRFRFTKAAGFNAVLMGIFLDPTPPPGATTPPANQDAPQAAAVFAGTDTLTQGTWKGAYGKEGFNIIGDQAQSISSIQLTASGQDDYRWEDSTADVRALSRTLSNDRLAVCWFSQTSFDVNVELLDSQPHRISLYFLDWDSQGRSQTVEVLDAVTGTVLDRQSVSEFDHGQYYSWQAQGRVKFRITRLAGPNAVLMGIFFDAAPGVQLMVQPVVLAPLALANGDVQVQVRGQIGKQTIVEASTDLKNWSPIWSGVLTNSNAAVTDPDARHHPHRFYRTKPLP